MDPVPRRRSRRDWFVDTCLFLAAVTYGTIWWFALLEDPTVPQHEIVEEAIIGAVGCAAVWLRRRWPIGLAVALLPLSVLSEVVDGAQMVALFTVAVHRSVRSTALIGTAGLLSVSVAMLAWAPRDLALWIMLYNATLTAGVIGWGLFVRHRRQLIASLRERAVRAETEAQLRVEQAQHQAREQIAREMHDVLGHRLSLLSVHAGALEYRPDAPAEEIAGAAAVIRASARQALQDLREVIGVLRAPVGELPQPTVADVPELVAESRRAGMHVDLHQDVDCATPDTMGRTAYRVVQEGLTNARKHAPGAAVTVTVTVAGSAGAVLTVEVVNTSPVDPRPAPAPGQGLTGLAERVGLAGGRLEHGPTGAGGWRLAAWLPWPA